MGAVDIGNSKVDLLVVSDQGMPVAWLRGGSIPPTALGIGGTTRALTSMVQASGQVLDATWLAAAGIDFPDQEVAFTEALIAEGVFGEVEVRNDIYAILASGADPASGLAVVCGAGMNAVGRAGDREVRYASLGEWSGDRGGGGYLGMMALTAACRSSDGRDPHSTLQERVREFFAVETIDDLSRGLAEAEISSQRLLDLVPIVFDEARQGDAAALAIVQHQAREVVDLIRATATRLGQPVDAAPIALGGSILRHGRDLLEPMIRAALAPADLDLHFPDFPAVVGAASAALGMIGVSVDQLDLARRVEGMTPTVVDTTRMALPA